IVILRREDSYLSEHASVQNRYSLSMNQIQSQFKSDSGTILQHTDKRSPNQCSANAYNHVCNFCQHDIPDIVMETEPSQKA
ncbi:MAG: hypothetical protein Q4A08_06860, partial [Bacteroidales bacterium]|nr:hypothetical protein [Bacteroidales bacterium]